MKPSEPNVRIKLNERPKIRRCEFLFALGSIFVDFPLKRVERLLVPNGELMDNLSGLLLGPLPNGVTIRLRVTFIPLGGEAIPCFVLFFFFRNGTSQ